MISSLLSRLGYFAQDFYVYLIVIILALLILIATSYKIHKSKQSGKRKKILIAFVSILFTVSLIYSGFEAYFRYVYDVPDGLGYLKVNRKWQERHVVHNNYFFRDRDFAVDKEPGITRIGILGDSITLGGGIEKVEDRFGNILQKSLRDAGYQVEVYNLGKSGHDTDLEIEEFKKVKHLNFDILIWQYFLNDIQPQGKSTGHLIVNSGSQKSKIVKALSDRSFFSDYLYWRFSQRYQKTFKEIRYADLNQYKNQEVLTSHKKTIADFSKELEDANIKTFVIIFPSLFILGPNYPAGDIHQLMGNYFRELGHETLDLLPDLESIDRDKLMASKFDPHPNEFVHKLAAQKLYDLVSPYLEKQ